MATVELLHIEDCPHTAAAADRIRAVASRLGVEIELRLILVASVEDALRHRFLGSPTVRVNSVDIDPAASGQNDFALCCRVYGRAGHPPESMMAAALGGHSRKYRYVWR